MNNISEDFLLRFDKNYPCWTKAMLNFLNVDLHEANYFVKNGLLENHEEVYFLSPKGREIFHKISLDNYLPIEPGNFSGSYKIESFRCELKFFLDKKHIQRWGFKEYEAPFCVYVPDIQGKEFYEVSEKKIIWNYKETPAFKKIFEDFPHTGIPARKIKAPSMEFISNWLNDNVKKFAQSSSI